MQPVDFYASEVQYLDHLAPIWWALDEHERGDFIVSRLSYPGLARHGIIGGPGTPKTGRGPIVVASYQDYRSARGRPVIFHEHGAGQTYGDAHPSNPGGSQRDQAVAFLCTNERVAQLNRTAYPAIPALVVGCPKLDGRFYTPLMQPEATIPAPTADFSPSNEGAKQAEPVVAISFHWDNRQCPESRWAFPHYEPVLADLNERFTLIGHGHPKVWRHIERTYRRLGIEPVQTFDEVLDRADVYVIDNSSTGFEFAATDRPTVWMNAPWYRRQVSHGLRFWDDIPGLECDHRDDLADVIDLALSDPLSMKQTRAGVVSRIYPHIGTSASRAAEAIREVVTSLPESGRSLPVDPYAPQSVKTSAPQPESHPPDHAPITRLRRAGATVEILAEATARWEGLSDDEKRVAWNELLTMTDAELLEAMIDMQRDIDEAKTEVAGLLGTPAPAEPTQALVPVGGIREVEAWVGGDPLRARTALAAEKARGAGRRKSLIKKLEALVG